jgi:hypothetical protein
VARGISQEKLERQQFSSSYIRKTTNLIDTSKQLPFDPKKGAHRQTYHLLSCRIS